MKEFKLSHYNRNDISFFFLHNFSYIVTSLSSAQKVNKIK